MGSLLATIQNLIRHRMGIKKPGKYFSELITASLVRPLSCKNLNDP